MDKDEVGQKITEALDKLLERDSYLLYNGVSERAITHHLASYLGQLFLGYDVDVEYNKALENRKELPEFERIPQELGVNAIRESVLPDIIIHMRGTHRNNLLVIEVKTTDRQIRKLSRTQDKIDIAKLKAFQRDPYHYEYAYFLKLGVKGQAGYKRVYPVKRP